MAVTAGARKIRVEEHRGQPAVGAEKQQRAQGGVRARMVAGGGGDGCARQNDGCESD
jgi:hypothetical protein